MITAVLLGACAGGGAVDPIAEPATDDTATTDTPGDTAPPEPPAPLELCLNEWMPDNGASYDAGDGTFPDWIEVHNPGTEAVDLLGWSLTDDRDDWRKFRIPESVVVPPGGFVVLLADGRPELGSTHLGFSLDADGEDVGLFRPDGHGEVIGFGVVIEDVAVYRTPDCGPLDDLQTTWGGTPGASNVAEQTEVERLVKVGSAWSYFDLGFDPGAWREPGFDDSEWPTGPAPLGYGDAHIVTELSSGPDPSDKWPAALFRTTFVVADVATVSALEVGVLRDDGVAVYLNGVEVLRDNLPAGPLTPSTLALEAVGADEETTWWRFAGDPGLLEEGVNTVAVQVHQASPGSSDLGFDLWLDVERPPAR